MTKQQCIGTGVESLDRICRGFRQGVETILGNIENYWKRFDEEIARANAEHQARLKRLVENEEH